MTTIDTLALTNFIMNGGLTIGSATALWSFLVGTLGVSALGIAVAIIRPTVPRPRAFSPTTAAQAHEGSICSQ